MFDNYSICGYGYTIRENICVFGVMHTLAKTAIALAELSSVLSFFIAEASPADAAPARRAWYGGAA